MGLFGDNTQDRDYRHNKEMRSLEARARIESVAKIMADPLNRGKPIVFNNGESIISGLVTKVKKTEVNGKNITIIYYIGESEHSQIGVLEEDETYESIVQKWQEACK